MFKFTNKILNKKNVILLNSCKKFSNKKKYDYLCIDPWSTPIHKSQIKKIKINLNEWTKWRKYQESKPNYKRREDEIFKYLNKE